MGIRNESHAAESGKPGIEAKLVDAAALGGNLGPADLVKWAQCE